MKKRLVVVSDLHCGHKCGLTPAGWQISEERDEVANLMEATMWKEYRRMVRTYSKFDGELTVVCNGDAIDGNRAIEELITGDRFDQTLMAKKCLEIWNADNYVFIEGTPFHTGKEENIERNLAAYFDTDVREERYLNVNGTVFYFRHKIGTSTVPYGRHTQPAKQRLNNQTESNRGVVPEADVMCFGHVHYHNFSGGPGWLSMSLPALQTHSGYGARECSGQVDWGITVFDVDNNGAYDWFTDIQILDPVKQEAQVI